jgi:cell division protease FtsH
MKEPPRGDRKPTGTPELPAGPPLRFPSVLYLALALLLFWVVQRMVLAPVEPEPEPVSYSEFRSDLADGRVREVLLGEERIVYVRTERDESGAEVERSRSTIPVPDPDLVGALMDAGITLRGEPASRESPYGVLWWLILFVPLMLFWLYVMRRMATQGPGGSSAMSFGKSPARQLSGELTGVTFHEVGGIDEVETELKEIIEFLKTPERFTIMGARLPKGVLLVGPPGTGKTLVARATAGEAGVPFFSLSGSDFVEMFVGVGAARVRDLFEQAKKQAPCIVFIDEIDAIGRSRSGVATLQSNDEREQTLNQLLNEMDGFDPSQGVVIMAATNRPEVLDRALLRAGRFDRQVEVPLPTEGGRRQILAIHTRRVPLAPEMDMDRLARITAGFSGADLANIVNEAALMAVRGGHERVGPADFDLALERVVAGLQRTEPLSAEVRRRVAYHEGGHALMASLLLHTDPVHRVSIIPTARGALGYTLQMPDEDRYITSRSELEDQLAVMMGGRAAELLVYGETSSGSANDLERVSDLARRMVTELGMSEPLGPVRWAPAAGSGYLGELGGVRPDVSPATSALIDGQVRALLQSAERRSLDLLTLHRAALDAIAEALQEREVVTGEEITQIAEAAGAGKEAPARAP